LEFGVEVGDGSGWLEPMRLASVACGERARTPWNPNVRLCSKNITKVESYKSKAIVPSIFKNVIVEIEIIS